MNKEDLIKFEEEIAELFNAGKIRAPVHLYHWNEDQIIDIIKLNEAEDIFPAYEKALNRQDGRSTLLVEFGDYYNEK